MTQTLSERAQRMLKTWERQPHVDDIHLVAAAVKAAGLPVTEPVLDFHRTFAGYITDMGGERGPHGIIHTKAVSAASWFKPMQVGGYLDADEPLLACADVHISWEMMIALDGTFYCNGPEASSYFMWTEQAAFMWDFSMTRRWRQLPMSVNAAKVLTERLTLYRINDISDPYTQVYGNDRFAVSIGQQGSKCDVLVLEGDVPLEFEDLYRSAAG